jgi:sugar phosphate isomerase/epimerase
MLRRDFLVELTAGVASAGLAIDGTSFASVPQRRPVVSPSSKLDRIAISTWSLRNYFRATRRSDFIGTGPMLALLDFPDMIVERYKVRHFEFCTTHFGSTEPAYLQEIKYALVRTGSSIVNMPVDIDECGPEGTFSDPDPDERAAALQAVKQWVDVAHALGVRSVRVGPGKVDLENLGRTAESYKALAAYALAKGVHVIVENHGDFGTKDPEDLVKLLELVGPGRIGALPDFANFPDESTRERGLKMLLPYAQSVCHAKGLTFDANGAETEYDFPKAMEIAKKALFHGVYSIEFEGLGDPYLGTERTLDELLTYL